MLYSETRIYKSTIISCFGSSAYPWVIYRIVLFLLPLLRIKVGSSRLYWRRSYIEFAITRQLGRCTYLWNEIQDNYFDASL